MQPTSHQWRRELLQTSGTASVILSESEEVQSTYHTAGVSHCKLLEYDHTAKDLEDVSS